MGSVVASASRRSIAPAGSCATVAVASPQNQTGLLRDTARPARFRAIATRGWCVRRVAACTSATRASIARAASAAFPINVRPDPCAHSTADPTPPMAGSRAARRARRTWIATTAFGATDPSSARRASAQLRSTRPATATRAAFRIRARKRPISVRPRSWRHRTETGTRTSTWVAAEWIATTRIRACIRAHPSSATKRTTTATPSSTISRGRLTGRNTSRPSEE